MGCAFPPHATSVDTLIATVRKAHEVGINFFDTSVMYRNGSSQAILGEALEGKTGDYYCATKVGYFNDPKHYRSVDALHVQLQENLRLLRRDSVDVLQIHEADWDHWWTDRSDLAKWELFDLEGSFDFANAPVLQFLKEAKERGLCRHVGITGNNARHIGRVIGEVDVDSVLVAYNYYPFNTSARDYIIPQAQAKGMAVIIAAIFYFVFTLPEDWRNESATFFGRNTARQREQLFALQKECGIPMAELVLRFVAADPRISTIALGAGQPSEVVQNVKTFAAGKLPDDIHQAVEAIAAQFER